MPRTKQAPKWVDTDENSTILGNFFGPQLAIDETRLQDIETARALLPEGFTLKEISYRFGRTLVKGQTERFGLHIIVAWVLEDGKLVDWYPRIP